VGADAEEMAAPTLAATLEAHGGSSGKLLGALVVRVSGDGVVDVCWGHSTESMAVGYMTSSDAAPRTEISRLDGGTEGRAGQAMQTGGVAARLRPAAAAAGPARSFGMIRHSVRLDGDDGAEWDDQAARPYDTPISDFELPRRQAEALRRFNFERIVSSPFRRCLQTAAVLARALGVGVVEVDQELGEAMAHIRKNGWPSEDHELTYLSEDGMRALLEAEGVALGAVGGEKPTLGRNDAERFRACVGRLRAPGVLLVTHGDAIGQAAELLTGQTVVDIAFCGWVAFEEGGRGMETDGVTALTID